MVNDYAYSDLFYQSSVDRQIKIETDSGTITNEELFWENLEINESLCSENELRFGSCEASQIKFKVAYRVIPMINKEIDVTMMLEGAEDNPFRLGKYKVQSDKPTADRQWRDIVAYDAMYDIINAEVSGWYNTILPNDNSTLTMRQFRKSFLDYFEIEEDDTSQVLANDSMNIQKTVQASSISGADIITSICEINGCFGHITREGKFKYIYLEKYIQGLWPANDLYPDKAPDYLAVQKNTGHLYPQDPKGERIIRAHYKNGTGRYEDFLVKSIDKLQIREEENDIGKVWPKGNLKPTDNCYVVEDNFLVYGKNDTELEEIAKNIYEKIKDITYRPFEVQCIGNPCLEVGDPIHLNTQYERVESYILMRTYSGIQVPLDTFSASGTEVYEERVNSTQKSIVQLKGKSNVLERTIDETKSEIKDVDSNLRTTITQTATEIRTEVVSGDNALSSTITQTANEIRAEVTAGDSKLSSTITQTASEIRAEIKNTSDGLSSEISQTASQIRLEVKNTTDGLSSQIAQNTTSIQAEVTRATKEEESLSGRITINTNSITTEVTRAKGAEESLSGRITVNAESITSEVTRAKGAEGTLSSSITQTATDIRSEITNTSKGLQSQITQNANGITAEVSRATTREGELNAAIQVNATAIQLRVTASEAQSLIEQSADSIRLKANRITWEATNSSLTEAGTLTARNAVLNNATIQDGSIVQETSTAKLTISNAELIGGYKGEYQNYIDFSNRVSGNSALLINGEYGIQIITPNLYVSSASSSGTTVYKTFTGTRDGRSYINGMMLA